MNANEFHFDRPPPHAFLELLNTNVSAADRFQYLLDRMPRITEFGITVNTHEIDEGNGNQEDLKLALVEASENLETPGVLGGVLQMDVVDAEIDGVVALETGSVRKLIHAHFILQIWHEPDHRIDLSHVNRRLQTYYDTTLGRQGTYVFARLNRERTYVHNYDRKQRIGEQVQREFDEQ